MAKVVAVVLEPGEHDDDDTALLPDHLPEVSHGLAQRTLSHDVGRVPGIMVGLLEKVNFYFFGTSLEYICTRSTILASVHRFISATSRMKKNLGNAENPGSVVIGIISAWPLLSFKTTFHVEIWSTFFYRLTIFTIIYHSSDLKMQTKWVIKLLQLLLGNIVT